MNYNSFTLSFLALIFIGFLLYLLNFKPIVAELSVAPQAPEKPAKSFTGRMIMPNLDDIYVLENSAGRNLISFENFLQGRAAGLHWAASAHFKKSKEDAFIGIKLSLDSLGNFTPKILFDNTKDEKFKETIILHIKNFWHYPKSAQGKFVVWLPFIFKGKY